MKRIAWFFPSFGAGGVQRAILSLTRRFLALGIFVDLVVADAHGPFLKDVPAGVVVTDLHAPRMLAALPGLISHLRTARLDALISAQNHANLVAVLATRVAGTPTRLILTEHNDMIEGSRQSRSVKDRLRPFAARLLYPLAQAVVAVSKGVAESIVVIVHLPPERICTIHNAPIPGNLEELVRRTPESPWLLTRDVPVVVSVGRLVVQKDYPTLLRALAYMNEWQPVRLMILGEGPERGKLQELAASLGVSDRVSMPGFVENPYSYMGRADAFALSSLYEGFPSVLVEALACGARVVATDCRSGPAEILGGGRFGRLAPVGDARALGNAIQAALEDLDYRPDASVARAREYSVERAAESYLSLIFGPGDL
jgi:glycosyltransferase involved in cell wall biosynthesis